MKSLHLVRSETGTFSCDVQPDSRNRWCVLVLHPAGQRRDMPARVRLRMEGDPCSSFETFVPAPFGLLGVAGRMAVIYVPGTAASLLVDVFGISASVQSIGLRMFPISRMAAAGLVALRQPARFNFAARKVQLLQGCRARSRAVTPFRPASGGSPRGADRPREGMLPVDPG